MKLCDLGFHGADKTLRCKLNHVLHKLAQWISYYGGSGAPRDHLTVHLPEIKKLLIDSSTDEKDHALVAIWEKFTYSHAWNP